MSLPNPSISLEELKIEDFRAGTALQRRPLKRKTTESFEKTTDLEVMKLENKII